MTTKKQSTEKKRQSRFAAAKESKTKPTTEDARIKLYDKVSISAKDLFHVNGKF